MFRAHLILLAIAAALFGLVIATPSPMLSSADRRSTALTYPSPVRVPVLVELFTSEGCSSCPPADELLSRLEQTQPVAGAEIIALSEHVDYWNRLGWTDPYSSGFFSARQNDYARAFDTDEIYTPQMIVDGRVQFVGSNSNRAQAAIADSARSAKATVRAALHNATAQSVALMIEVGDLQNAWSGDSAEVMLAITESGLRSSVSRGENAGRRLSHTAVVRSLSKIGKIESHTSGFQAQPTVSIHKDWKRENLKAVVFVQQRPSRRVIGSASLSLAK
ncbi:MAG TPA: DUF1223 domain-containing protein [Blastocatellia bacterium]|nr:DUF1223 domain-containing protein [Blastocatellia bacterium]